MPRLLFLQHCHCLGAQVVRDNLAPSVPWRAALVRPLARPWPPYLAGSAIGEKEESAATV